MIEPTEGAVRGLDELLQAKCLELGLQHSTFLTAQWLSLLYTFFMSRGLCGVILSSTQYILIEGKLYIGVHAVCWGYKESKFGTISLR